MVRARILAPVLGLLLAVLPPSPATGDEPTITETSRADFAWFDGIGFPSCAALPFVRLTRTSESPKEGDTPWTTEGFLLEETPSSFTIIGADVLPSTFQRRENGLLVEKEPADLRKTADLCLASVRDQVKTGSRGGVLPGLDRLCWGPVGGPGTPAELFILARRCAERGLEDRAAAILKEVQVLAFTGAFRSDASSLRKCVEEAIADEVRSKIVVDHGDITISRPRLLEEYKSWLRRFSDTSERLRVEADTRVLETMVAEDARHKAIPDEQLASLPADQRVRELLFRLRDQVGEQTSNPGAPSIHGTWPWSDDASTKDSIAKRIRALGLDAVPTLIDSLEDARFTRVLGFHRSWNYSSYYVMRIGDGAQEILKDITGKSFWTRLNTNGSMIKDGQAKEVRERYLKWWKEEKSR